MKIRSITCFHDIDPRHPGPGLDSASGFLRAARDAYVEAGIEVQTVRLALSPFGRWIQPGALASFGVALEKETVDRGIEYVTVGPARLDDPPEAYEAIPDLLAATQTVFTAAEMANRRAGVDLHAIRRCASVIRRNLPLEPDGFANLRFAALANVDPGVPFLPAAYHTGGPPRFAIATEAADLANVAFDGADTLDEARARLIRGLEDAGARIQRVAASLGDRVAFGGIDFSLAPFPSQEDSIGAAMERLGVPALGLAGSTTAAALLTAWGDAADIPHTGFSGLFLPVLEDPVLADRAAEGTLTVEDLLLYSTVCGTGLDTVPLSGDIAEEELVPILLDVATLALRHAKPLTARLMPIPGKTAGDPITFDFPFFADGRVMAHRSRPLQGPLASAHRIPVPARRS